MTNIVDWGDNVIKAYSYDAYGNTKTNNSRFRSRFAYTGAIIDTETGRFISQDSYRGEGEAFWHLYAYCNGDPVNFHDPTGNLVIEITACSLVAIGVALYLSIDYAINRERSLL